MFWRRGGGGGGGGGWLQEGGGGGGGGCVKWGAGGAGANDMRRDDVDDDSEVSASACGGAVAQDADTCWQGSEGGAPGLRGCPRASLTPLPNVPYESRLLLPPLAVPSGCEQ